MAALRHGRLMAKRISRWQIGLVGVLVAVVGVAGCGGGRSTTRPPAASPTASASANMTAASPPVSAKPSPPSPSVSPSASPSYEVPAAARVQSEAGAVAFVKFYFDQMNKAWMGPDTNLLLPLSDPGCKSCANLQDEAATLRKDGERLDRPAVTVLAVDVRPDAPPGQVFLVARLRQNDAQRVDRQGVVKAAMEASEGTRQVAVIWKEDRWLLYGMAA